MKGLNRKQFVIYSFLTWVTGLILTTSYFYMMWLPPRVDELKDIIGTRHLTDGMVINWIFARGIPSGNPDHAAIASVPVIIACLITLICYAVYSLLCFKRMTNAREQKPEIKNFMGMMLAPIIIIFLNKVMFGIYSVGLFLFLAISKGSAGKLENNINTEKEEQL